MHKAIYIHLTSTYLSISPCVCQVFTSDGAEVKKHVGKYVERMDHMVEEALRLNVKWSLQELARAISSDGKSTLNPLFKVKVMLTSQVCTHIFVCIGWKDVYMCVHYECVCVIAD